MPLTEERLLEAELMSSSPEHVYAWLKERAETTDEYRYTGENLEQVLLSRESDLIDLGLARYGFSCAVVKKLFSGKSSQGGNAGLPGRSGTQVQDKAQVLRLAALSNRMVVRLGGRMPYHLFRDDDWCDLEPICEFVTSANADEMFAIFQNPTIDGDVLNTLYAKERPFDRVTDERWEFLIMATAGNPRLRTGYVGPMDGWAEYKHDRVSDRAWALAEKVPVTDRWASKLQSCLNGCHQRPIRSRTKWPSSNAGMSAPVPKPPTSPTLRAMAFWTISQPCG